MVNQKCELIINRIYTIKIIKVNNIQNKIVLAKRLIYFKYFWTDINAKELPFYKLMETFEKKDYEKSLESW